MARRSTNKQAASGRTRTTNKRQRSRARKKPFVLRWFHLLIGCISAFALGYLIAFGQVTKFAASAVGLR